MSEDFVRSVLKEHARNNTPERLNLWPQLRSKVQAEQVSRKRVGVTKLRPAMALTLALLVVGLAGGLLWSTQPKSVSAEEIFAQAEKVSKDAAAGGISTGHVVAQFRSRVIDLEHNVTGQVMEGRSETWYEAPDKLSSKTRYTGSDGVELEGVSLELGDAIYASVVGHEEVRIMPRRADAARAFSPLNMDQIFSSRSSMGPVEKLYTVTLVGNEQVIGRAAYVLEWNVTPEVLEAEAAGGFNLVRHKYRLWIDQHFYLVLKLQAWDRHGVLIDESNVEILELNKRVGQALFEFNPPAGYVVIDMRPASGKDLTAGWREVARQVAVTLYEPGDPGSNDTELRKPYYVAQQGVVTQALVRKAKGGEVLHAVVVQGPPSAIDENRLGTSTPMQVGSRQGRLYRKNEASYLVFDIESTRIMLYSSNMSEEGSVEAALARIGASLVSVGEK